MSTGWDIDGTDLRTLGYEFSVADGWDSFPASRFSAIDHPFRTGNEIGAKTLYGPRNLTFSMWVFPQDITGEVTTSPLEHLQDNLDTLFGVFHSDSPLLITRTMPDATTRTINGRVLQAFQVRGGNSLVRKFVARINLPYPFWKAGTVKNVTGTGAQSVVNLGNAPIHNALITFTTAGRLTIDSSGDYIDASAAGVIVDLAAWTIEKPAGTPADNLLSHNRAWLVMFGAGTTAVTATGTIDIDFFDSYI